MNGYTRIIIIAAALLMVLSISAVFAADAKTRDEYDKRKSEVADDDADGHYKLGRWCAQHGLPDEALEHYEAAIGIDPDHKSARKALGYVEYEGKWMTKDDAARAELVADYKKRLAKLLGDDADGHNKLGEWCESKRLVPEAESRFKKAIEIEPAHAKAHANLGEYLAEGKWTKIGAILKKYVAIDDAEARKEAYDAHKEENPKTAETFKWFEKLYRYSKSPTGTFRGADNLALGGSKRLVGSEVKYYLSAEPEEDLTKERPLLICLHGMGSNGDSIGGTFAGRLGGKGWIIAAATLPPGQDAVGAGWPSAVGNKIVRALVAEVTSNYNIDGRRIGLVGVSFGGGGAWYVGSNNTRTFSAVAVMCGFPIGPITKLKSTPLFVIHGDQDELCPVKGTRDAVRKLRSMGAPVTYVELAGVGHHLPGSASTKVADWLAKQFR